MGSREMELLENVGLHPLGLVLRRTGVRVLVLLSYHERVGRTAKRAMTTSRPTITV